MGKDLNGKELGTGLLQRKDGKYSARFLSKSNKRIEKYFDKISEAKRWLAETKYEDEHGNIGKSTSMTVNAWFEYWIKDIKSNTVRENTVIQYRDRYNTNIRNSIGHMLICEVKPMHCQNIINNMIAKGYKVSTMAQTRITLLSMFSSAQENDIILRNPITRSVKCPKKKIDDEKIKVMTIEEQNKFLEVSKKSSFYKQYLFVLQTGLRAGELVGLKWDDVDFSKRVIYVRRSANFHTLERFTLGEPKSISGYRSIPLTDIAYQILMDLKKERRKRKVVRLEYKDLIFLNKKNLPTTNIVYNNNLKNFCDKAGIEKISMHTLRHTFATRCIEAGMRPKTLQKILGHASISVTMDLYVHVTEDSKEQEMKKLENYISLA